MPHFAAVWQYQVPTLTVAAMYACTVHLLAALLLVNAVQKPQVLAGSKQSAKQPVTLTVNFSPKAINTTTIATTTSVLSPSMTMESESITPADSLEEAPALSPQNTLSEDRLLNANDVYWPRSQLTTAPQLQSEVALNFPNEFTPEQAHYGAILRVYINAAGGVDKIEVEDQSLPEPLIQAAIAAFQNARYQPGQREQNAVKSMIRIEVSFESIDLEERSST